MGTKHWTILVATAVLIGPAQLARAGGAAQIHESVVLTQSGPYEITRSFNSAGPPAITVDVGSGGNVVIRLCGHKLTQLASSAPVISIVSAETVTIVGPGTLAGGGSGVRSTFAGVQITVDGLRVTGSSGAGVKADDAKSVVVKDTRVDSMGAFGIDFVRAASAELLRVELSGLGSHGVNAVGNKGFRAELVRVLNAQGIGLNLDGTGATDPSAYLADTHVMSALGAVVFKNYAAWGSHEFTMQNISGHGVHTVNSNGGSARELQGSGIGGDLVKLENSSGNTFDGVRGNGIAGYGVHGDDLAHDNVFKAHNLTDAQLDALYLGGDRNWVDHSSANEPGSCPIHLGPNSQDNLVRQFRGRRSAGPCACAGTLTGAVCDEGTSNPIAEQLP